HDDPGYPAFPQAPGLSALPPRACVTVRSTRHRQLGSAPAAAARPSALACRWRRRPTAQRSCSWRRAMTIDTDRGIDSTGGSASLSLSDALSTPADNAASRREQEIRSELANNPQALQALDRLAANLDCYVLSEAQQVQALDDFMAAPNAATAAFVEGRIAQALGVDPSAAHALVSPDAGTLTIGGQTYAIDHGALVDAQGARAGTITNDGLVRIDGEEQARNVYADLGARVQLRETIDGELATVLDLHPADRRGRLDEANVNQDFADRVKDTLVRARQE